MIIKNNNTNEDNVNLLEYILSITYDKSLLFPQELNDGETNYLNNKTINNNYNNKTRFSLSTEIDKFISYFPTSIIQLFVIIFLICFILSICKCYKFLDLLRQRKKIDREISQNSAPYLSPSYQNYIHYRDESSSFKDNCCCYWLSKRYYCLRRLKRRILGFRKTNNEKTRRGKRRYNNKKINRNNMNQNEEDSVICRRKSIVYRCNNNNNRRRASNFNYNNNNIARGSISRYLQSRSVRQLN
jgi:hypothetical protein